MSGVGALLFVLKSMLPRCTCKASQFVAYLAAAVLV
jgi:hypothetical protein